MSVTGAQKSRGNPGPYWCGRSKEKRFACEETNPRGDSDLPNVRRSDPREGNPRWSAGVPLDVNRVILVLIGVAVFGSIMWMMVGELETGPGERDEAPAIIMRPPEGFAVEVMGVSSIDAVAAALGQKSGSRLGIEYSEDGDRVILLADRTDQKIIEMRASRTGTIVERIWRGEVDQRLLWAAQNGNLDAPGLPPPTGKNLYH